MGTAAIGCPHPRPLPWKGRALCRADQKRGGVGAADGSVLDGDALDGGDALGADGARDGALAAGGVAVVSAGAAELAGAGNVALCFLPCLLLAGAAA